MNTILFAFIGVYSLPPICIGYLIGGLIMKKFKITVKKAACIAFSLSLIEYLLFFLNYMWTCDNFPVAGLTASYEHERYVISYGRKYDFHNC